MWIIRTGYEHLCDQKIIVEELEKEVNRLAEQISSQTKDCKIGPWCKDCKHYGTDRAEIKGWNMLYGPYVEEIRGQVVYCKKHLHEICPEFEMK